MARVAPWSEPMELATRQSSDPLDPALGSAGSEAMKLLLSSPLVVSTRYQPSVDDVEAMLLAKIAANSAILNAASSDDVGDLRRALENGADVNNVSREWRQTALILASENAKLPAVRVLLQIRNVNIDVKDLRGHSALSIASLKGYEEIVMALVGAGASITQALVQLTSITTQVNLPAIKLLVSPNAVFESPSPFLETFRLSRMLRRLSRTQREYHGDFLAMASQTRSLAASLLDQCENLWEVRRILRKHTHVLDEALRGELKDFIARPPTQTILKERWLGKNIDASDARWLALVSAYLASPVLLPVFAVQYLLTPRRNFKYSQLGELFELCNTPYFKFIGNAVCFFGFMCLLVSVIVQPSVCTPSGAEIALAVWILSLVLEEFRELSYSGWRDYIGSPWNWLDWAMLSLFSAVILLRVIAVASTTVSCSETLFAANMLLSVAALFAVVRVLSVSQASYQLGPLLVRL